MKLQITMKTPDCFEYAVDGVEIDETTECKLKKVFKKFFSYDEYLTVEIDSETETCVVIEKGR